MHEGTVIDRPRTQIIIERPRLTKLLDEAGARIILLLAPAGYGKTTLAQQWTRPQERVDWYAGGRGMIDVAGLSVGIAEVLARMGEPARSDMVERVRILAARGHDPRGLAKAVSGGAPGADWLLVLDDYHHALDSEDAEAFLEELVALTEFRLLITSRERPTWLPARKVVYGEAAVIEMDALAFTDEEALLVLGGRGEEIVAEARGWPAVIGLAAMRGGVTGIASGLAPEELYRFFAEDLFRAASPALQEALFLMALAGVDAAGASLGPKRAQLVAEAAARGFLVAESRAVHPLFRMFLVAKLREQDDRTIATLIRRALHCLSVQRRWDDTLFVLQQFPDDDLILDTLRSGLIEILDSGRVASIKHWLALARERDLLDEPVVLLAEAEVAVREREDTRAHALGEQAGNRLAGDLASRAYLAAARAAHLRDSPNEVARLCTLGLSTSESADARLDALWVSFASALEHAPDGAADILDQLRAASGCRPVYGFRLKIAEGLLCCQAGRVHEAVDILKLATGFMSRIRDPFVRTNFFHHLAYALILSARYEEALSAANNAFIEGREAGLEFVIDHALIRQSSAYIGMRQLGQARGAIAELDRRAASASDYVLAHTVLERIRFAITAGDFEAAQALLATQRTSARPAFAAEIRAYQAILYAACGDTKLALRTLGHVDDYAAYVEGAALADATRAMVAVAAGDSEEAIGMLAGLFDRGEIDAIVTGYRIDAGLAQVVVGTTLEGQMTESIIRSRDFDLARRVGLEVSREARPRGRLSAREQDVYELLVQGRSNAEIARTLFISESTTKVHVRHIFEKLGVHTRAAAASLANEL